MLRRMDVATATLDWIGVAVSDHSGDPDAQLVVACKAGDNTAFATLVARHQRGMWHLVFRYVRNQADASDVVQQSFVKAYQALSSFRGEASVRSWLYRIAIHSALSWLRKHKREQVELSDDMLVSTVSPADQIDGVNLSDGLRTAICSLPPKQRQTLELRVFDELSFAEISAICSCSENTAKVNFHHAVAKLKQLMGNK